MSTDLSDNQEKELYRLVGDITDRHINRTLNKMWATLGLMGVMMIGQVVYVAFAGGSKLQQLNDNTRAIQRMREQELQMTATNQVVQAQLAAISATQVEMNAQLTRIENNLGGK